MMDNKKEQYVVPITPEPDYLLTEITITIKGEYSEILALAIDNLRNVARTLNHKYDRTIEYKYNSEDKERTKQKWTTN